MPIELPLIQQLQSLLEQEVPNADAINEAYKKLEANDKNLVLEELSTFLQIAKTIKRSLPVTLLGQLFLTWPGTLEQKRDALLKISPTSESNIEAESLANFMQELFVETVGIEETCRVVGIPLEVVFDAGFGNEIFVVGCGGKAMNTQGEWLDLGNWNTPIKLACTESVKWITKLSHTANECKIKFLLNGKYWQDGEDITIFPGQENVKIEKINFNFDKHFEKK